MITYFLVLQSSTAGDQHYSHLKEKLGLCSLCNKARIFVIEEFYSDRFTYGERYIQPTIMFCLVPVVCLSISTHSRFMVSVSVPI